MRDHSRASAPPPRAVVFGNDEMAIGGMVASCASTSCGSPVDVAVTGFDDIASSRYSRPGLTTVRQPMRQLGEEAVRAVLRADGRAATAPRRVLTLPTELVMRSSCGCRGRRMRHQQRGIGDRPQPDRKQPRRRPSGLGAADLHPPHRHRGRRSRRAPCRPRPACEALGRRATSAELGPVDGAAGYLIERTDGADGEPHIVDHGGSDVPAVPGHEFADTGLRSDVVYSYRVGAVAGAEHPAWDFTAPVTAPAHRDERPPRRRSRWSARPSASSTGCGTWSGRSG